MALRRQMNRDGQDSLRMVASMDRLDRSIDWVRANLWLIAAEQDRAAEILHGLQRRYCEGAEVSQ